MESPPPVPVLETKSLSLWYGKVQALKDVNLSIASNEVTALIGPSGCGKSTLLRCFNRMNDFIIGVRTIGEVLFWGNNILDKEVDSTEIRYRIGMVFQKPNPFPKSIFDNVAFGPRVNGWKGNIQQLVERSLRKAALWDETKDRLKKNALELSGGQQQRLCIARAIALEPEVLLMDEPCSSLDPIATEKIEELIRELQNEFTVVIVTHNMQQAARISTRTAFMLLGSLAEVDKTERIFTNPKDKRTEDYITGRFG